MSFTGYALGREILLTYRGFHIAIDQSVTAQHTAIIALPLAAGPSWSMNDTDFTVEDLSPRFKYNPSNLSTFLSQDFKAFTV